MTCREEERRNSIRIRVRHVEHHLDRLLIRPRAEEGASSGVGGCRIWGLVNGAEVVVLWDMVK